MQRAAWPVAGLVSGVAGIAVAHALTMRLTLRPNPFVSVGEFAAARTPGWVQDTVVKLLGNRDTGAAEISATDVLQPWLTFLSFVGFAVVCALVGVLARRGWWQPVLVQLAVGLLGVLALLGNHGATVVTAVPVVAGVASWIVVLSFVVGPLQRHLAARARTEVDDPETVAARTRLRRRDFVIRTALLGLGGAWLWLQGGRFGRRLRHVDETRRLLNLPIKAKEPHPSWRVGVPGVGPWRTPNDEFFVQHTALVPPAVELAEWRLRVHGLVERPLELTYQELIERQLVSSWTTLVSVVNPVGGDQVGTAWWSGVPVAALLQEAGVQRGADAVLQTSVDGWTCLTPLYALTDARGAMLAVGMNGEPLPIEHGYPVRTIVPGLFGHVSACKWLTSLEVTTFDEAEGEATRRGFGELGPVKLSSRIEVPTAGAAVDAGTVRLAGSAWAPRRGVTAVEVAVDGGPWLPARLAEVPSADTWVQWELGVELSPGTHAARVRAIARDGEEQTGVINDIRPDGATGWHEVEFDVT